MELHRNVEVFGDSILKGIQLDDGSMRYHVDNNIDIEMLEKKFLLNISNFSKFGCTISKAFSLIEKRFRSDKLINDENMCHAVVLNLGGNDCDFDWKAVAEHPEYEHQPNTPLDVFADTYKKIIEFLKENGIRPIVTTLLRLMRKGFITGFAAVLTKVRIY